MLHKFTRIGGIKYPSLPHRLTPFILQTDGSYNSKKHPGMRIAVWFEDFGWGKTRDLKPVISGCSGSTEAEWASVAFGLDQAIYRVPECRAICIENDNLGVIRGLTENISLRHEYSRFYRREILELTQFTEWTAVRWIPRKHNMADKLMRK